MVPHHRRYIPGTMVVETTWHTPTGWLVVQDLMVIRHTDDGTCGGPATGGPLPTGRRRGCCCARPRCVSGKVEMIANCVPLFNYGVGHRTMGVRR